MKMSSYLDKLYLNHGLIFQFHFLEGRISIQRHIDWFSVRSRQYGEKLHVQVVVAEVPKKSY